MKKIKRRKAAPEPIDVSLHERASLPEDLRPTSNDFVRKWARSQGIAVSAKGRIAKSVLQRFADRDEDSVTGFDNATFDRQGEEVQDPNNRSVARGKRNRRRASCGFCGCQKNAHRPDLCPGIIRNGKNVKDKPVWVCLCAEKYPDEHPRYNEKLVKYRKAGLIK